MSVQAAPNVLLNNAVLAIARILHLQDAQPIVHSSDAIMILALTTITVSAMIVDQANALEEEIQQW